MAMPEPSGALHPSSDDAEPSRHEYLGPEQLAAKSRELDLELLRLIAENKRPSKSRDVKNRELIERIRLHDDAYRKATRPFYRRALDAARRQSNPELLFVALAVIAREQSLDAIRGAAIDARPQVDVVRTRARPRSALTAASRSRGSRRAGRPSHRVSRAGSPDPPDSPSDPARAGLHQIGAGLERLLIGLLLSSAAAAGCTIAEYSARLIALDGWDSLDLLTFCGLALAAETVTA